MARVKRSVTARKYRKNKILDAASGFRGRSKNCFTVAIEKVEKAGQYAYRDRRARKRQMRALWIQRINAFVRARGLKYSQFIDKINKSGVAIDRKMFADLAVNNPEAFDAVLKNIAVA